LGDVAFCCKPAYADICVRRLNGRIHLLLGNHDPALRGIPSDTYASVQEGIKEITVEGQKIVLCHYALREWQGAMGGAWHLFGHTHGGLRPFGKSVDVGVDNVYEVLYGEPYVSDAQRYPDNSAILYHPVSFADVKAFMDAREIGPHTVFAGAH